MPYVGSGFSECKCNVDAVFLIAFTTVGASHQRRDWKEMR